MQASDGNRLSISIIHCFILCFLLVARRSPVALQPCSSSNDGISEQRTAASVEARVREKRGEARRRARCSEAKRRRRELEHNLDGATQQETRSKDRREMNNEGVTAACALSLRSNTSEERGCGRGGRALDCRHTALLLPPLALNDSRSLCSSNKQWKECTTVGN